MVLLLIKFVFALKNNVISFIYRFGKRTQLHHHYPDPDYEAQVR